MQALSRIVVLLGCLGFSSFSMGATPDEVLDQYFTVLVSRNFEVLGSIMDPGDMEEMRKMLVSTMDKQQQGGQFDLQKRLFGKKVQAARVREATADFYLHQLARQILTAANTQHLMVDSAEVLGFVAEGEGKRHYVARIHFSQQGRSTGDLRVYTLAKQGDTWKMQFPMIIRQMLQMIETTPSRPKAMP